MVAHSAPPVLISYPKSGRTWFRFIFDLAGVDMTYNHSRRDGTPLLDVANGSWGIFLYRNPIDSAVSHFFHLNHHKFRPGTWRHFKASLAGTLPPRAIVTFLADERYGVRSICNYVRGWLDYLDGREEFLKVTYEEMRTTPVETLRSVLHHVDPATAHDVEALVEQSAFKRMRSVEDTGERASVLRLGHKKKSDPDSRIVRKGKIGGYRDYLSEADQRHYEEICAGFGLYAAGLEAGSALTLTGDSEPVALPEGLPRVGRRE